MIMNSKLETKINVGKITGRHEAREKSYVRRQVLQIAS